MVKIYDGFLFDNELELLELRLQEHWDYVHKFIIVESTRNHRNQPKELGYADNRERFAPWADKIQHIIIDHHRDNGPWVFKNTTTGSVNDQQRNVIPWGLYDADPADVLLICDVDELWRRDALQYIHSHPDYLVYSPKQIMSHFNMNFVCKTYQNTNKCHGYMSWSKGIRVGYLKDEYNFDATAVKGTGMFSTLTEHTSNSDWHAVIPHGGWHFSWWGANKSDHLRKLDYYGHSDQDTALARTILDSGSVVGQKLSNPMHVPQIGNMFPEHEWAVCEVDDYYPDTITSNITKYRRHILPNHSCKITDMFP